MRRIAVLGAVLVLVTTACGSLKSEDEIIAANAAALDIDESVAPGSGSLAVSPGDGDTPASITASSTTTSTATAGPGAGSSNDVGSSDSGSTSGTSGSSTDPGSGDGNQGATVGAPAAAGTYTYDQQGTSRLGTSEEQLPPTSTLVVDPPDGRTQRFSDQDGAQETVLLHAEDAVRLVSLTIRQATIEKRFAPPEPVVFLPLDAAPGDTWSWEATSDDEATDLSASFEVLRLETVDVGGTSVETLVVHATFETSGDIASTTDTTQWVSLVHSMTVKDETHTSGGAGLFTFSQDSQRQLRSLEPA